jgi:hypothetical protein
MQTGSKSPKQPEFAVAGGSTSDEKVRRQRFMEAVLDSPIPPAEFLANIGLFVNRQTLSRFLFINHIYQRIITTHGIVAEFGVRWGQNMALFVSLRGIYEPFNHNRKIVGFDTFEGFPSVHEKDGSHPAIEAGAYGVTTGYEAYLDAVLNYHEQESPIAHIRKFELVKGDAIDTLNAYLRNHPETIFALIYFDFDLYKPTVECLERVMLHLTKGSVLAFDELNCAEFPGETIAVREVIGTHNLRIQRVPYSPLTSYAVIE